MFRKPTDEAEHENLERWLLTYSDLITLLLAFFIIMYSMSKVDTAKFERVSRALQSVLRGNSQAILLGNASLLEENSGDGGIGSGDLKVLKRSFDKMLADQGLEGKITATLEKRGLVIRIAESTFFDLGSADLMPQAASVLDLITELITKIPNHIRVEGHTDNLPIKSARYPSNWELSVNRATVCVRYLIEKHGFNPEKIAALGYGEYRPIASNDTVDGRNKNRRVDIIVLNMEDIKNEPLRNEEDISSTEEKYSGEIPINPAGGNSLDF